MVKSPTIRHESFSFVRSRRFQLTCSESRVSLPGMMPQPGVAMATVMQVSCSCRRLCTTLLLQERAVAVGNPRKLSGLSRCLPAAAPPHPLRGQPQDLVRLTLSRLLPNSCSSSLSSSSPACLYLPPSSPHHSICRCTSAFGSPSFSLPCNQSDEQPCLYLPT